MTIGGVTLANTAALWGLLGVPALVVVHFFQQRSRRVALSTRFLIDALAPESSGGRTWERFRSSRAFWLQILAVLLLVWVLVEPRWPRADSSQTVVIVLDDAMSLRAAEDEARAAAAELMREAAGRAARTEWIVMGSDPRRPALYRGLERARAVAALADWRPSLGTHDYEPALRLGRGLAGAGGACWFVTDREEKVPPDQAAVGVGHDLANVGFAGGAVRRGENGAWGWQAVLKNHAAEPQRRAWWIESATGSSERREVELPAEGVLELSGAWPANAERATLRLAEDGFAVDDALPLLRPVPKPLSARVGLAGERGEFFRKLLGGIEGVEPGASLSATLRVLEEDGGFATPPGPAVVLAAAAAPDAERKLVRTPVVAERHSLVEGLNWQGLLGPGPATLKMAEGDEALLWQGETPLAWLRAGAESGRQLVLNLDWQAGNVARLPATVLLLRRYVEGVRDARPGAYAANFDAGAAVLLAPLDLAEVGVWTLTREGGESRVVGAAELPVLRAPAEPGFFEVKRGETTLVRGAAQFADARQGDFRGAGAFRRPPPVGVEIAARDRNTQGDPLAAVWLALAGAALLASWWPGRARDGGSASMTRKEARA